jgi:2-succinyl-6-hydroxy-2,4-cyclohexadiene-1-carboxylate synthase
MTHLVRHRTGESTTKLFLHGLLGSGHDWSNTIAALTQDSTCLTLDLPSHGSASELEPHVASFEDVIHQIGSALSATLTTRVHGIGYSLGGRILLGLTKHYPTLFTQLTFISAFPGFEDESARTARIASDRTWSSLMRSLETESFLARWYAQDLFRSDAWSAQLRERILSTRATLNLPRIAPFFEVTSSAKMPSYWSVIDSLAIPTTFVVGERDLTYLRLSSTVAARNPRIRVEVIQGCAHAIHLENPDMLAQRL